MQREQTASVGQAGVTMGPDFGRAAIDRSQARSMVISSHGIVASEHPLASQAGAMILARGGHAVDAAIAANAVMGVVEPMMDGVGGDLFAIVYDSTTGQLHGINASGWTPAAMTFDFLQSRGLNSMPQTGIHPVTVPGAVSGWALLGDRFGRTSWSELLGAAIRVADEGFPVTEIAAAEWASCETLLRTDPNTVKTYLPAGRAPRTGEMFRNPDLTWTLTQIATKGPEAFYRGDIAQRLLACSNRYGGAMTTADLAEFRAEWIAPISTTYRGWSVYELPPNGQGIAALIMLNILENFPLGEYGHNSAEALHLMIEAKKLAYADMIRHVADPRAVNVPVTDMLSKTYAQDRATLIDRAKARGDVAAGKLATKGTDTTYLSVVDRDGNMVSLIQSVFAIFGSGLVPEGLGFVLQNRGGRLSMDPAHPNALAPRKRPLHTIIPAFMSRGDIRTAFGIVGGWNQSQAHVQFVSNIVDHGMNIQAALEAPRFTKITFEGCDVIMEGRMAEPVRAALGRKGHQIELHGSFSSMVGSGQSVSRDTAAGVNYGASVPRRVGAAIPEPLGF
jgi:gamma-glutamyltranspeptidase/glutathione hydrolase